MLENKALFVLGASIACATTFLLAYTYDPLSKLWWTAAVVVSVFIFCLSHRFQSHG